MENLLALAASEVGRKFCQEATAQRTLSVEHGEGEILIRIKTAR